MLSAANSWSTDGVGLKTGGDANDRAALSMTPTCATPASALQPGSSGPERPERLVAEPLGLLAFSHIGAEAHSLREVEVGQGCGVLAAALGAAQQRWQRHRLRLEDALHLLA